MTKGSVNKLKPNEQIRIEIIKKLKKFFVSKGLSQKSIQELCSIQQPRVSDLMREKYSVFSIDYLVTIAVRAGFNVEVRLKSKVNKHLKGVKK